MNLRQKLAVKQIADTLISTSMIVEEILESKEGTLEDKGDAIIAEYDKATNIVDAQIDGIDGARFIAALHIMQNGKECMIEILKYVLKGTELEEPLQSTKCNCKEENASVSVEEIFGEMPQELKTLLEKIFKAKMP